MTGPEGGYLLDTSVLSSFAPGRPGLPAPFVAWLREREHHLFIPSVAVAELEQGICKLRRTGAAARATALSAWLDRMIEHYADRVLPLDSRAARSFGQISDAATAAGKHPGFPDVAIAAMAKTRKLTVLTQNVRHFSPLGVACADPFKHLPA